MSRAVLEVYARAPGGVYARRARERGIEGGRTGMVTALQRAGEALNTNVRFDILVLDGVFTEAPGGALAFHPATWPSDAEVVAALATIRYRRVQRLLVRHGLEPADDAAGLADRLAEESPVLAGIVGASVQGRVALPGDRSPVGHAGMPGNSCSHAEIVKCHYIQGKRPAPVIPPHPPGWSPPPPTARASTPGPSRARLARGA
jgi:hypothetical protein